MTGDGIEELIGRLVALGLIARAPSGRYVLTAYGRERVQQMVDRHPVLAATMVLEHRRLE